MLPVFGQGSGFCGTGFENDERVGFGSAGAYGQYIEHQYDERKAGDIHNGWQESPFGMVVTETNGDTISNNYM